MKSELDLLADRHLLPDPQGVLDERAGALLCYTSGTTGHPKGVLASHRSTVIHTLAAQSACAFALTPQERVLLSVPLFHAFGWGLPYVAAIAGAKLVLPGPAPDSETLVRLIRDEGASFAMTETALGLLPAQIAPFVAMRIGVPATRHLTLTAARFKGAEAVRLGIGQYLVKDSGELDAKVEEVLKQIDRCAPMANARTKEIVLAITKMPLP